MVRAVTRRRAIGIIAAAAGLPLLYSSFPAKANAPVVVWTGQALGAPAKLVLHHGNMAKARRLIDEIVLEVARLEGIFSLYRDDSILAELNRVGGVAVSSPEMVSLLDQCLRVWERTGGLFDPTVQPVWEVYRDHFASGHGDEFGPSQTKLNRALGKVGFEAVRYGSDRIAFAERGMAMTLNGVAQGFITDRVAYMLRNEGFDSCLVNMGEERAVGAQSDGTPWHVGLATTEDSLDPDAVLSIVNRAVATSSPTGFVFDEDGKFGHILHPKTGSAPMAYRRVTVIADDATTADALSTAFNLMDVNSIRSVLKDWPGASADLVEPTGERHRI